MYRTALRSRRSSSYFRTVFCSSALIFFGTVRENIVPGDLEEMLHLLILCPSDEPLNESDARLDHIVSYPQGRHPSLRLQVGRVCRPGGGICVQKRRFLTQKQHGEEHERPVCAPR